MDSSSAAIPRTAPSIRSMRASARSFSASPVSARSRCRPSRSAESELVSSCAASGFPCGGEVIGASIPRRAAQPHPGVNPRLPLVCAGVRLDAEGASAAACAPGTRLKASPVARSRRSTEAGQIVSASGKAPPERQEVEREPPRDLFGFGLGELTADRAEDRTYRRLDVPRIVARGPRRRWCTPPRPSAATAGPPRAARRERGGCGTARAAARARGRSPGRRAAARAHRRPPRPHGSLPHGAGAPRVRAPRRGPGSPRPHVGRAGSAFAKAAHRRAGVRPPVEPDQARSKTSTSPPSSPSTRTSGSPEIAAPSPAESR